MSIEVLKQMVAALEAEAEIYTDRDPEDGPPEYIVEALKVGRQAIGNAEPQASFWKEYWLDILKENNELHERIAKAEKQEQGEPVVWYFEQWQGSPLEEVDEERFNKLPESVRFKLYEAPQPAQKPLTE